MSGLASLSVTRNLKYYALTWINNNYLIGECELEIVQLEIVPLCLSFICHPHLALSRTPIHFTIEWNVRELSRNWKVSFCHCVLVVLYQYSSSLVHYKCFHVSTVAGWTRTLPVGPWLCCMLGGTVSSHHWLFNIAWMRSSYSCYVCGFHSHFFLETHSNLAHKCRVFFWLSV